MSHTIKDLNITASSEEMAAIKLALASIIYAAHTPDQAKDILSTIRSAGFNEAMILADDIEKFSPPTTPDAR